MNEKFPQSPVDELKKLIQLNQVFRVGIVKTRFVTEKFSNPWLLHSFDIKKRHREELRATTEKRQREELNVTNDMGAENYNDITVKYSSFVKGPFKYYVIMILAY